MIADLALPFLRLLSPETAHRATIRALAAGLGPKPRKPDDPILGIRVLGRDFPNPIGIAAGFDKNAEVPDAILDLGCGFAEIGSVTPRPQAGNPRPRLFRLPADGAVINRMGFNNDGVEAVADRLARRAKRGILGVNLGKNKETVDAAEDYCRGIAMLGPFADYLVINVSSPNTPGLRDLQRGSEIAALLARVVAARDALGSRPPLLLKVAPDLDESGIEDLAAAALKAPVDGLIVSNTTVARPDTLRSRDAGESGGLSGRPLFGASTRVLAQFHHLLGGRLPLIGVGGVGSGEDAYAKIRAGASLVQLYTALIYRGPGLVGQIKRDLAFCLRRDGFNRLADAVGTGEQGGGI